MMKAAMKVKARPLPMAKPAYKAPTGRPVPRAMSKVMMTPMKKPAGRGK